MMRLIDADELLKSAVCLDGVCNVSVVGVDDIRDAPTIDPESLRPHGEWVYGEDIDIQCSACVADAMTAGDYRQDACQIRRGYHSRRYERCI